MLACRGEDLAADLLLLPLPPPALLPPPKRPFKSFLRGSHILDKGNSSAEVFHVIEARQCVQIKNSPWIPKRKYFCHIEEMLFSLFQFETLASQDAKEHTIHQGNKKYTCFTLRLQSNAHLSGSKRAFGSKVSTPKIAQ